MPSVAPPSTIRPGTSGPVMTPSTTPTVTPSPTPTPLPSVVIGQGERNLRNGNWDLAVLTFQQVLADPGATVDEQIMAELGLSLASLKRGDFATAAATLDTILAEHPDHPKAAQAAFLRGDARLGLNNWEGAIADFQTYLALKPGLLDSPVYERIADAHLALGQNDQALQAYAQALNTDRYLVSHLQLREKVANINRSLGNPDGAIAQYRAILEVAQNTPYRASVDYYIAQTYLEAGQLDAAYEQLNYVFMTYPNNYEALSSAIALLEAGYTLDPYQRGLVNFNQEQYDLAAASLYNYLALTPIGEANPEAHLYIAYSYRALGNIQAAQSELQAMINRYGPDDSPSWGDAWLELADIHAVLGSIDTAYATYEEFVSRNPTLPQAPEALYRAARLAQSLGDYTRSVGFYQRLAAEYPADPRASEGLIEIGLVLYQAGDLVTAEQLFTTTASMATNSRPATSYLWLGKTLQAAGRTDEANQALNAAVAVDGKMGYYALRATDLLMSQQPFTPPANTNLSIDPDEGRAEAEQWLTQQFGLAETPPLTVSLRADLATDIRLLRGKELWDLGMLVDARDNFESLRKDFENDPLATYQLAIYFREIGLYRSSILAARQLHKLAGIGPLDGPVFLSRLRYPVYFSDLVIEKTQQYNLDPLYVFALIWQESIFEGFAISSASAQGLMQIWPPTGDDIAAALAWPDYHPSDLQRPTVNVAFGTWLLRDELDRFRGDPYATLAAYNAGSGNAGKWQDASGGDPDLYVELITLQEPQTYIQRIYEHYAAYKALYGSP